MNTVVTVDLPPNKTFSCRHATFIRVSQTARATIGVVEIRESTGPDANPKCSPFALRGEPIDNGIQFRLTKPGGEEKYHVFLACGRAFDHIHFRTKPEPCLAQTSRHLFL